MTEESIQSAIVAYLRYSGWKVLEYAKPRAHGKLGGIIEAGHPDLLAIKRIPVSATTWPWATYHLWIEVKQPGKKPSPDQERLHAEFQEAGAWIVIWRSLEDAIATLAPLGLGLADWLP